MKYSLEYLLRILVWCVLVSCFCEVALAMPHYESGQLQLEHVSFLENSGNDTEGALGETRGVSQPPLASEVESLENHITLGVTTVDTTFPQQHDVTGNNGTETSLAYLPTAASISAKNNEPTTTTEFSAAEQAAIIETTPEPTKETEADNTLSTAAIAITTQGDSLNKANEISTEEDVQPGINRQQQEVPEILEPLVAEPTMPSPSYTPLPQPPVIEPISYSILPPPQQQQQQQQLDKGAFVFPNNLPIIAPGASSPSLQLIPPPNSPSPDVPQEPVEGQLPQSPEPATPIHPYNLYDIPISLLSLSGNSGGSNSDMATISNLANPTGSVPLDFTQFRYHVETGQLIKIGSQGPGICPKNMRFFAVPGHPKNGACDCDYYQCSRPLIYSPDKHECYWAWSQGPCDKGEWFVFDKDLRRRGSCKKNPCPTETPSNDTSVDIDYYFQDPTDEQCYQAGTQGYCADQDERLLIYPDEPIPKCRKFTVCYPLTVPQELQCIFGNKYYVESGQCQQQRYDEHEPQQ